jgi:hypothetical protein
MQLCEQTLIAADNLRGGSKMQRQFPNRPTTPHDCARKHFGAVQINPTRKFPAIIPVLQVDLGADLMNFKNGGAGRRALGEGTGSKQQGNMNVSQKYEHMQFFIPDHYSERPNSTKKIGPRATKATGEPFDSRPG